MTAFDEPAAQQRTIGVEDAGVARYSLHHLVAGHQHAYARRAMHIDFGNTRHRQCSEQAGVQFLPGLREFGARTQFFTAMADRSEEHTSELQSLMRHTYA